MNITTLKTCSGRVHVQSLGYRVCLVSRPNFVAVSNRLQQHSSNFSRSVCYLGMSHDISFAV